MQEQKNIIDCYNKAANNYAEKFIDELKKKHFDRILLNSFASENLEKGRLIDLGCGPGQTTKYLFDRGIKDILGTDISKNMIAVAEKLNPQLNFEVADMLNLSYADKSFGSAIAFYSIVHFSYEQIRSAFKEVKRVLMDNGQFLFSFHTGTDSIHLNNFLEQEVNIDFYFFEISRIIPLLEECGFALIDVLERQPYENVEHPSTRAYVWVENKKDR